MWRNVLLDASCFMKGFDWEDVVVLVAAMAALWCGRGSVERFTWKFSSEVKVSSAFLILSVGTGQLQRQLRRHSLDFTCFVQVLEILFLLYLFVVGRYISIIIISTLKN